MDVTSHPLVATLAHGDSLRDGVHNRADFPPAFKCANDTQDNSAAHTWVFHRTIDMKKPLILASGSQIRSQLITNAGIQHEVIPARIDEQTIKASLQSENASPRDIADALAEFKARKVAQKHPEALVLGCDQVLEIGGDLFSKPISIDEAKAQLQRLSGKTHRLLSAAVLYHDLEPIWRHVGVVRLTMRTLSEAFIDDYLERNWDSVCHAVGAYKLEEEGVRLFAQISGDHFNVLGLPLTELISYLIVRGELET